MSWSVKTVRAPSPLSESDVQITVDSMRRQGEERGQTEAEIEASIQWGVAAQRRFARGETKIRTMKLWHRGPKTRCDVLSADKAYLVIDYYDGTNAVALIGYDKNPQSGFRPNYGTPVNSERYSGVKPNQGFLVRERPLSYSVTRPGDLLWMAGARVTDLFSRANSTVQANADGSVTLEKAQMVDTLNCLLRLRLSPTDLKPISMECFIKDHPRPLYRWSAGRTQNYPGGVAFLQTFRVEEFNGRGQAETTEDYTIIHGAFNRAADLGELRVPPGSVIDDMRFGEAYTVSYQVGADGLLSDAMVREKLVRAGRPAPKIAEKPKLAPASAEPPRTSAQPQTLAATDAVALLILGASLCAGGCLVRAQSKRA